MSNIYELLNLNADILVNFALQGRHIENNIELDRILRNSNRKLKAIEDRMQDDGKRPDFNLQSIEDVISKVKSCSGETEYTWTTKELRIVSYHMIRFRDNQKTFDYALKLLEANWKDLFINGLMFFLMNSWNVCPDNLIICVCDVIKKHILSYTGPIQRYQILKEQSDLLEKVGPIRLATLLTVKKITPQDAPCILGYKRSALTFPFFSDVIINYYKRQNVIEYTELEELVNKHSLDRTRKLLYAHLVEAAENSADENVQDMIVRSARRILGDINVSTTWTPFTGATPEDVSLLNKAKDLVIAWGARKTVDAFFDICVQDPHRRNFWLGYIGNIMDYRIVGSTTIRTRLQVNSEVAPLLRSCFIETNSKVSTTAALVLFIKDKVFVEFSDVGSLYIYNITNRIVKDIKKKRYLNSTSDLKNPSIGKAIDQITQWSYYCCSDEGQISHRGDWQSRVSRWLLEKLELLPNKKTNCFGKNDPIPNTKYISPQSNRSKSSEGLSNPYQASLFPKETKSVIPNTSTKSNVYPGTRIKTEIHGIQSKWIFDESCRLLADTNGIYVHLKNSRRTYYVSPSLITNIEDCRIWLIPCQNNVYSVRLLVKKNGIKQETIGSIERVGLDIIYHPLNGTKVNIHTQ